MGRSPFRRSGQPHLTWVVVTVVVFLSLGAVPIVSAHANLVEATPGNGDQVTDPPEEVTLQFSEGAQLATVTVTNEAGERVERYTVYIDDEDPTIVHLPLKEVSNGTFTVNWQVLSVDGHTTRGSFFFVVGDELPDRGQLLASLSDDDGTDETAVVNRHTTRNFTGLALA
jgi:methionine-rich copper-binding protein CopC